MGVVPKFGYGGGPPEVATLPAGLQPHRELSGDAALRPPPRVSGKLVPRFQRSRREDVEEETTMARPMIPTLSGTSRAERFIALR